jgi:ParB/RepB/Spo0J family partition protein
MKETPVPTALEELQEPEPTLETTFDPMEAKPIKGQLRDIPIGLIDPPKSDVREFISEDHILGLAESMRAIGLIHEPLVTAIEGRFEIVSGHCRLMAATKLGWPTLRCKVISREEVDREFMKLHENIFRQDLSAVEKARALFTNKVRFELTDEDLGRRFGLSRSGVTRLLGALKWPQDLIDANTDGVLGFEVCDVLRKIADKKYRAMLIGYAISDGCSKRLALTWYNEWLRNERLKEQLISRDQDPAQSPLIQSDEELLEDARRQQANTVQARVGAIRQRCSTCGGEYQLDAMIAWTLCMDCVGALSDMFENAKRKGLVGQPGA